MNDVINRYRYLTLRLALAVCVYLLYQTSLICIHSKTELFFKIHQDPPTGHISDMAAWWCSDSHCLLDPGLIPASALHAWSSHFLPVLGA